jgi:hypothetical protein
VVCGRSSGGKRSYLVIIIFPQFSCKDVIALLNCLKSIQTRRKNIYEVLKNLKRKSTNFMLLIFSVPFGTRKSFVRDNGTRGK